MLACEKLVTQLDEHSPIAQSIKSERLLMSNLKRIFSLCLSTVLFERLSSSPIFFADLLRNNCNKISISLFVSGVRKVLMLHCVK